VAGKRNISVIKGNTFNLQFTVSTSGTAWNLTNYSVVMTVKPYPGASTTLLTATTSNGYITLDPLNGRVIINVPASITTGLEVGRHNYDIVFTVGTTVTTILEGNFIVTQGVTV
jgi:hypothetical protein